MSTNCVLCIKNDRVWPGLYCQACRDYRFLSRAVEKDEWPLLHNGGWMEKQEVLDWIRNHERTHFGVTT